VSKNTQTRWGKRSKKMKVGKIKEGDLSKTEDII
jgi:hypothetical protein